MKHTLTHLELIAGLKDPKDPYLEAYLHDSEDCGFIRVEAETEGEETFGFTLKNPEGQVIGKLDFPREQAYFLHSWLNALLFDGKQTTFVEKKEGEKLDAKK